MIREAGQLEIIFSIQEGSRYRFAGARVEERDDAGSLIQPLQSARALRLDLKRGAWFDRRRLVSWVSEMMTMYRDAGHAHVEMPVALDLDDAHRSVTVTVPIHRGPLVTIERIDVFGLERLSESEARGILGVEPRTRFHETNLLRARDRLRAHPAIEAVELSTEAGPTLDRIIVSFEVEERSRWPRWPAGS